MPPLNDCLLHRITEVEGVTGKIAKTLTLIMGFGNSESPSAL